LLSYAVGKIHSSAWLLTLLSAILQVVIFPLPGLYGLAWIAVGPLLIALLRARPAGELQVDAAVKLAPARPWQGFLLGYLCGILWSAEPAIGFSTPCTAMAGCRFLWPSSH
jgi:apolipoprotein N-acyltransferase